MSSAERGSRAERSNSKWLTLATEGLGVPCEPQLWNRRLGRPKGRSCERETSRADCSCAYWVDRDLTAQGTRPPSIGTRLLRLRLRGRFAGLSVLWCVRLPLVSLGVNCAKCLERCGDPGRSDPTWLPSGASPSLSLKDVRAGYAALDPALDEFNARRVESRTRPRPKYADTAIICCVDPLTRPSGSTPRTRETVVDMDTGNSAVTVSQVGQASAFPVQ
jgi:hypothetical protein